MFGISFVALVFVFVLGYIVAIPQVDLSVNISQLESQLQVLIYRLSKEENTVLDLKRQLGSLELQLENVTQSKVNSDPTEVAFTAMLTHTIDNVPLGTTLKFDHLIHRTGTNFDVSTSIFTCPTSGLYLFSVFIETHSVDTEAIVHLMKDGKSYMSVISERSDDYEDDTGGNVCLLNVNKGQRVWVETYTNDKQSFWPNFSTFSGVLIHRH